MKVQVTSQTHNTRLSVREAVQEQHHVGHIQRQLSVEEKRQTDNDDISQCPPPRSGKVNCKPKNQVVQLVISKNKSNTFKLDNQRRRVLKVCES